MLTVERAKELRAGDRLYSCLERYAKGGPKQVRVTSVKTWVRQPNAVLIHVKYGFRQYFTIASSDFDNWALTAEEADALNGS